MSSANQSKLTGDQLNGWRVRCTACGMQSYIWWLYMNPEMRSKSQSIGFIGSMVNCRACGIKWHTKNSKTARVLWKLPRPEAERMLKKFQSTGFDWKAMDERVKYENKMEVEQAEMEEKQKWLEEKIKE
jgi:hypothetical protein